MKTIEMVSDKPRTVPADEAQPLIIASLKWDLLKRDFELLQLRMNQAHAAYQMMWESLCAKHNLDPTRDVVTETGEVQERR